MTKQIVNNSSVLHKLVKIESKINQQRLSEILGVSTRYIRYIKENKRSIKNQEQSIIELYDKLYTTKKYKQNKKLTKQESDNFVLKEQKLKFKTIEKSVNSTINGKQLIYEFKNKWSKLNKNFSFHVDYQYKKILEVLKKLLHGIKKYPVKIFVSPVYDVKNGETNKIASSQHTFLLKTSKDISKYLKAVFQTFKEYQFYVSGVINSLYSDSTLIKVSSVRITILNEKNNEKEKRN